MQTADTARPGRREALRAYLALIVLVVLIFALMCAVSGVSPGSYLYKTYLLQARAWLRGETALSGDYSYLELAVYNGQYYVSFPPVPSVPMVLYTLIWGENVPGGLFQKLYVLIAALVLLSELLRTGRMKAGVAVCWALFISLGSAMLPVALAGGVWYEAQTLAYLFSVCAIVCLRRDHPLPACLFYALSIGCRPFTVCLGPVLLLMYLRVCRERGRDFRAGLVRLLPGIAAGLAVACAYGAYNYVRFGNPLEFGHNYLPEFTRAEHGQLSLVYVRDNLRTLLLGAPFSADGTINAFGFSMFLSCPIFICQLIWLIRDALARRITAVKWTILAMEALNVFLLAMHRTLGGYQFGARYALEMVPLCLIYLLESPEKRGMSRMECVLMGFGLIFNLIGGILIHV